MKYFLSIVSFFIASGQTIYSQNIFLCQYGENGKPQEICNYLQGNLFKTNSEAETVVDRILNPLGLPRNFILVSCPKINNAVALTSSKDGIRYIVYDNNFMESIDKPTSKWSSMSILAHEIGHHLCGHTTSGARDLADQRRMELEADDFSGFVMFKLGASLTQAQAAMKNISADNDDTYSTHPKLSKRLVAIKNGFNKAKNQQPISNLDNNQSAEFFNNEGLKLMNQNDFQGALEKFTTAVNIKEDYAYAYNSRGICKGILGDHPGAIKDYTNAIKIDPSFSKYYTNRGVAKRYNNDCDGAMEDIQKAIQLDVNDGQAFFQRGITKKNCFKDLSSACIDFSISCNLKNQGGCDFLKDYCK